MTEIFAKIDEEKYIQDDSVLVRMPDGGSIALTIVRDKKTTSPQPVILMYNIYAGYDPIYCKEAVQKGYIGIVANTRGKRLSPEVIEPFEHDAADAYNIIDWISKQSWCNGKVGMYGGSYLGFSQWSAVKHLHPALKTIVPQVSVGVGIDYPAQNGVFMSYMLRWIHYVTNNKLTDETEFGDSKKWENTYIDWYKKGNSFRSLDTLEGRPNAIFQRWLKHPSYDTYWQNMTPQKEEFSKISIPILTTTGYYDDDQLGAMYYYNQYQKWNKSNNYYLLIGPYSHSGAQGYPSPELAGYKIDSVANISIQDIVFQWFNYTLKDSMLPEILKDKVNFEVMGANEWKHVPTLEKMHNDSLIFYLGNGFDGKNYSLLTSKPKIVTSITQKIDLKDRTEINIRKDDYAIAFPKIIDSILIPEKNKLVFISEPIDKPFAISGAFSASIIASINKKDMDIVIDLYEETSDGKFFALCENLQRASLAKDASKRQLLQPNTKETIELTNNFITSKQLKKGSRIIILVGVLRAGSLELPISEIEFELKRGQLAAVFALGKKWQQAHGLILDARSKSERGDRLALLDAELKTINEQKSERQESSRRQAIAQFWAARTAENISLHPKIQAQAALAAVSAS